MSNNMSSTNKGNYIFCENCIHKLNDNSKYPCSQSHRKVRDSGGVKYERDFKMCGLKVEKQ